MTPELNLKLIEKYPEMFLFHNFRGRGYFVIECGDGWYNILDQMFNNIHEHIKNHNSQVNKLRDAQDMIDNGYRDDVPNWLLNQIEALNNGNGTYKEEIDYPGFQQIKEKFGTARIYYNTEGQDDYIDGLVSMAESMSGVTCEECGNVGKIGTHGGGGWVKTLCDEHSAARALAMANNQATRDAAKWSDK